MATPAQQHQARLREEAAEQVLQDAIAALRLTPFQRMALEAAADAYARARAARLALEDPIASAVVARATRGGAVRALA